MLVLSRKIDQTIKIGDDVCVTIKKITGSRVSIAIEAPSDVRILRGEKLRSGCTNSAVSHQERSEAVSVSVAAYPA